MYSKSTVTTLIMAASLLFPTVSSFMPLGARSGSCDLTASDTCKGRGMCHKNDGSSVCCGSDSRGYACGGDDHKCNTWFGDIIVNCD
ncbi:hypothetical protein F4818DRAFT_430225 [Hypoxylon cercidicola]|nr:hypothetical protein F4818DRAFT_430225 [Hypoxylon cercidicola]